MPVTEIVQGGESLLYADIDVAACVEPKQLHDISGGYNRFDIFDLRVNRKALRPISFEPNGDIPPAGPACVNEP